MCGFDDKNIFMEGVDQIDAICIGIGGHHLLHCCIMCIISVVVVVAIVIPIFVVKKDITCHFCDIVVIIGQIGVICEGQCGVLCDATGGLGVVGDGVVVIDDVEVCMR